jgi:hypothetical protein
MAMRDDGPAPRRNGTERAVPREQLAGPGRQRRPSAPGNGPARYAIRIGDAERDIAAAELGDHYAAGRLSLDELHERIGLVLSARTHGQLGRVMRDLPPARQEPRPAPEALPGEPVISGQGQQSSATADRDGRVAAIGLLLLAMLIWLFTVVMFTRHGYYYHHYPHNPYGPWRHP